MRTLIKKIPFFALIFLIAFVFPLNVHSMEDAIIAIVNDEVITLKDLRDYIRATYINLATQGISDEQLREIMADLQVNGINKLIEDRLMLSKAKEVGLEVRDKLIEDKLAEIKTRYSSEQEFLTSLVEYGGTVTELRNKILDQLKIRYVIEFEVKSKIYVNPQEVTNYYNQNKHDFQLNETVNLKSIYIAYGDNKNAARIQSSQALQEIQDGANFEDVAEKYSQTPSVGVIERGHVLPVIESTVFALSIDDVSPMVEVDTGIYIFKLTGRTPSQIATLTEVKDKIYDYLHKKKFKERFNDWVEELKQNAFIEIKE